MAASPFNMKLIKKMKPKLSPPTMAFDDSVKSPALQKLKQAQARVRTSSLILRKEPQHKEVVSADEAMLAIAQDLCSILLGMARDPTKQIFGQVRKPKARWWYNAALLQNAREYASLQHFGLLHFLGTHGGSRTMRPPENDGTIRLYGETFDDDHDEHWEAFELTDKCCFWPSQIVLPYGQSAAVDVLLRHTDLQGSWDGKVWQTLHRTVKSKEKIVARFPTWEITNVKQPFRHFRLILSRECPTEPTRPLLTGCELFGVFIRLSQVSGVQQTQPMLWNYHVEEHAVNLVHLDRISALDQRGLIYYLGSTGGRKEWVNPALSGVVTVNHSDAPKRLTAGKPGFVTGRSAFELLTSDKENSWVALDLGKGRKVRPTKYVLRHGLGAAQMFLRSWNFEASTDNIKWKVLKSHKEDLSLHEPLGLHCWDIEWKTENAELSDYFRYFRIRMTGPNSQGTHNLSVTGLELYGHLIEIPMECERIDPDELLSAPARYNPESAWVYSLLGVPHRGHIPENPLLAGKDSEENQDPSRVGFQGGSLMSKLFDDTQKEKRSTAVKRAFQRKMQAKLATLASIFGSKKTKVVPFVPPQEEDEDGGTSRRSVSIQPSS